MLSLDTFKDHTKCSQRTVFTLLSMHFIIYCKARLHLLLEKAMAPHSSGDSCLESPVDGGAWWAAGPGVAKSDMTERLRFHFSLSRIGEGNGNPLQCSCLENPRNGGA